MLSESRFKKVLKSLNALKTLTIEERQGLTTDQMKLVKEKFGQPGLRVLVGHAPTAYDVGRVAEITIDENKPKENVVKESVKIASDSKTSRKSPGAERKSGKQAKG